VSYRAVGIVAAAVQLALMSAYVWLETVYGGGFLSGLVGFVGILVFPAVGVLILSRHPHHLVGILFCLSQLGWAVNNVAGSYVRAGSLPNAWLAVWLYIWPGILSGAALIVLLLLFPDGQYLSPRWKRLAQVALTVAVVTSLASAIAPGPVDPSIGITVDNPLGVVGPLGDVAAVLGGLGYPLFIPMFLLAAVAMVRRYRRSGTLEREQLKWLASSVVLSVLLSVGALVVLSLYPSTGVAPLWAQIVNAAAILSISLVPVAAAVAILRYRLYDIDVLINRALVYGPTTAGIALAFFGVVLLVQTVLSPFTQGNELAVAVSTLASLALFQPLRRRIQAAVDRRFYRSRYDAARTLDAFSARLRDEVDLDAVRADLIDAVQQTVQPTHASVWLRGTRP